MRTEIKYCRIISFILLLLFFMTIQHYAFKVYTILENKNTIARTALEQNTSCKGRSIAGFFSRLLHLEISEESKKPTTLFKMACSSKKSQVTSS